MIELPEAHSLARQLNEAITGQTIDSAIVGKTPHGFAFYCYAHQTYAERLTGRTVRSVCGHGGHVWIDLDDGQSLILGEGAVIRLLAPGAPEPKKHQLYARFGNGSSLVVTISMYAFIVLWDGHQELNPYLQKGLDGPNPLDDSFDFAAFEALASSADAAKLTAKGLLATGQRLPGVGSGVLQDILFNAEINPKCRVSSLNGGDLARLFRALKGTLTEMRNLGGRDTDTDIYGQPGGYPTLASRKTVGTPCPRCGNLIVKEAFLGGSVYFCPHCQPVPQR